MVGFGCEVGCQCSAEDFMKEQPTGSGKTWTSVKSKVNWLLAKVAGQSRHQATHNREFYSNYFSHVGFLVSPEIKTELTKNYQKCHHGAVPLIKPGIQRLGTGMANAHAGVFRWLLLIQKFPIQVKTEKECGRPFWKKK